MGLKSDLQQLNTDLNSVGDKLDADLKRLEDKLANTPVQEDVSEELASLRATVSRLQSLDRPDPDTAPNDLPGTVVPPETLNPPVDENTTNSPGEPDEPVEEPVSETPPAEPTPAENPEPQGGNTESV